MDRPAVAHWFFTDPHQCARTRAPSGSWACRRSIHTSSQEVSLTASGALQAGDAILRLESASAPALWPPPQGNW
eukprot:12902627-Prorocentrum_lima.AAC.1